MSFIDYENLNALRNSSCLNKNIKLAKLMRGDFVIKETEFNN